METNPEVPASTADEALFQCTKPSGVPRGPSHLQFPRLLRATMRSPLRSPAQVEGPQGVLPQPEKDLERPSSTCLEARFPYCREPAYCILSAYCILHIECCTFHSIIFQDLE